jgi:quercetin dioxygenase-like cupin family protein
MKKLLVLVFTVFWFCLVPTAGPQQREAFQVKGLLKKDLSSHAGGDMLLTVGEVNLAPGATGSKHRHPGPTFVYVLEGAVEIELEGTSAKTYHKGESFYEEPHQLHITTRNVSQTEPARILVYHLSRKGKPLTQPEK